MRKLPASIPQYSIDDCSDEPFSVKWEELMGWFLVPRIGEKLLWGIYDASSGKCSRVFDMRVTGKAMVHGIEGVELTAKEYPYSGKGNVTKRTFIAQLTDTHCRFLAALRNDGDVRNYITFLDGDAFLLNWGFGEDNCGNETNLAVKGKISRSGKEIRTSGMSAVLDIIGRYSVSIGGKTYDTVCVMDIETYNQGVVSQQYLDRKGRTILWRRFNRDDFSITSSEKKWSEQLPNNERLTVNGQTYVHWFDCITDHIL